MNQRLAAHKSRKSSSAVQGVPIKAPGSDSSRAGQAAARVAARYAKAPSYSEMQAAEAHVAKRPAQQSVPAESSPGQPAVVETMSQAAPKPARPQRAASEASESARKTSRKTPIESTHTELPERTASQPTASHVVAPPPPPIPAVEPAVSNASESRAFGIRWDPDMPFIPAEPASTQSRELLDPPPEIWTQREVSASLRNEPIEVAGSQPPQANLIQFPRELIATRKLRPRLAEMHSAAPVEAEDQLSIFEVDPQAVAAEPATASVTESLTPTSWNSPAWNAFPSPSVSHPGPEWSGMELDAQPWQVTLPEEDPLPAIQAAPVAHIGWRLMASMVDTGLIGGAFVLATFAAAINMRQLPTGKPMEVAAILGLVSTWLVYHLVFLLLAKATPGMNYAGIRLCTVTGKTPSRAQLRNRFGAMILSLLPVGFGAVWALFDEQHLSWHDRISHTYLRMR